MRLKSETRLFSRPKWIMDLLKPARRQSSIMDQGNIKYLLSNITDNMRSSHKDSAWACTSKPKKWHLQIANTLNSLYICAVWPVFVVLLSNLPAGTQYWNNAVSKLIQLEPASFERWFDLKQRRFDVFFNVVCRLGFRPLRTNKQRKFLWDRACAGGLKCSLFADDTLLVQPYVSSYVASCKSRERPWSHMRTANARISLCVRLVRSRPLLFVDTFYCIHWFCNWAANTSPQQTNNVATTSLQRRDVAATL